MAAYSGGFPLTLGNKLKPELGRATLSKKYHLINFGWLLVTYFVPQILSGLVFSLLFGMDVVAEKTSLDSFDLRFAFMNTIVAAIFTIPFLRHLSIRLPGVFYSKAIPIKLYVGSVFAVLLFSFSFQSVVQYFDIKGSNVFNATADNYLNTVLGILVICIVAPILEEFIFRGVLFRLFLDWKIHGLITVILTSLAFTFIHSQYGTVELLYVFLLGCMMGVARWKTDSLKLCIFMHFVNNVNGIVDLF